MNEIRNERSEVMEYLATANSLIKLSTGAVVNGFVKHDIVVIHEACPRVVKEILDKFVMVSLAADGLHIPVQDSAGV